MTSPSELNPVTYRLAFVIEQALGHKTHAQNLRNILSQYSDLDISWIFPEWQRSGLAARIPIYRSNWTVQSGLQARKGLSRNSRNVQFDGLFFHTQVPAVLSTDWVERFPSVVSLDATPIQYDSLGEAYEHHPGPAWLEDFKFRLNRRCFHAARHLVTWSRWAKDGLIADYGIPSEKIDVIPPGVDLQQWQMPSRPSTFSEAVKILFVGGNLERKGGLELIAAFQRLRENRPASMPPVELHLVTLDQTDQQPGIFVHQGLKPNSPDLKKLYAEADIFCLPTHGDCLPMALAEAGAVGLPMVSTHIAAIPEIVQDGVNGFLVQPKDVQDLAQALERLANDEPLRREMGAHSHRIVAKDHDVKQNAERLVTLIKDAMGSTKQVHRRDRK